MIASDGLMLLSSHIVAPSSVAPASYGMAMSVGTDWCLRLGHPGLPMMHAMSSKGLIPKLMKDEVTTIAACEVWCAGKMAQSPRPPHSDESQGLEKIDHIRICGSRAGSFQSWSFYLFSERHGCRAFNLLKSKSDAFAISKT